MNPFRFRIPTLPAGALALALLLAPRLAGAVDLAPSDLHSRLAAHLPDLAPPGSGITNGSAYLQALAPRVLPVPATTGPSTALVRSNRYASQIGYLRIGQLDDSLPERIAAAAAAWSREEPLSGLVLDLRTAFGTNFASALRTARVFGEVPVAEFKMGSAPIPVPADPLPTVPRVPLALLVNRQTRGAAEVLAAAVRRSATPSVLIGTNTAGQARAYRPVSVADTLELQVAGDPVVLPGGQPFPIDGLQPDLAVQVAPADEELYLADEFQRVVNGRRVSSDNTGRLNEAELVRRRRGLRSLGASPTEPPPRGVQDPALARALDLLDALAAESRPTPPSDGNSR